MTISRRLRESALSGGLVLALLGAAPQLHAQPGMDSDGPPPAFAGGQSVRGTVTAVAADHLTVKTETGESFQIVTTPNTRLRKGRDQVKLADIHVGDGAGAMGVLDPPTKTLHAMMIGVVDAEQVKKARESLGKTWIAGKVTAIDTDALKITVQREDGVAQVIGLDDDTSFKRGGRAAADIFSGGMMGGGGGGYGSGQGGGQGGGDAGQRGGNRGGQGGQGRPGGQGGPGGGGESITLADLKVGDMIAGQGAVKSGVFVPTELRVANPMPPGGQRRRQRGDGAQPGAPAAEPKA